MAGRALRSAVLALLAVEVLDELVFGAREAAWPLIRRDLELSYAEVGLLLSVPAYVGAVAEPGTVLLGALGLATAGWYSIPKARLYAALPGQSGAALTLGGLAGAIRAAAPLAIGLVAERYGLDAAMWLLLAAPVGLLLALPRS